MLLIQPLLALDYIFQPLLWLEKKKINQLLIAVFYKPAFTKNLGNTGLKVGLFCHLVQIRRSQYLFPLLVSSLAARASGKSQGFTSSGGPATAQISKLQEAAREVFVSSLESLVVFN